MVLDLLVSEYLQCQAGELKKGASEAAVDAPCFPDRDGFFRFHDHHLNLYSHGVQKWNRPSGHVCHKIAVPEGTDTGWITFTKYGLSSIL